MTTEQSVPATLPAGAPPLRIGLLGASRIAPESVIGPAAELGHRLVAVAARDRDRAEQYAAEHGIERVLDSYQAVIDDPEVEVVYNPLANSLHGEWNAKIAAAGKAILSEKPFARNAVEAREVAAEIQAAGVPMLEGFHYYFHPGFLRSMELLRDGAIGRVREIQVHMSMPTPPDTDPRWSYALAGGSMMDLGCYALHVCRTVGERLGAGTPSVTSASCELRDDLVDVSCDFALSYRDGTVARAHVSMEGEEYDFTVTYTGDQGTLHVHDFLGPHRDDLLTLTRADGTETIERVPARSTYTYQLDAFAAALRGGAPLPVGVDDAVANMTMIDEVYRAAGLPPR